MELMVGTALAGGASLAMFNVLLTTTKLSSQNVATNVSSYRARQTLDRIGEVVRFAQDTPVLINADGTTAAGTTSDGILVKNARGGPYVIKNSNGQASADIPAGATAFLVEYSTPTLAAPVVGDYILFALSTQPSLEVTSVAAAGSTGSIAKVQITTKTGLTELAKPGSYTVTGSRFNKEAYIFSQANAQWSLRHYPRVTSTTNFTSATNYHVLGTGFQKLGTQSWFTTTTDNGTQSSWLRAVARSSDHAESAAKLRNTLTSMPVQIKLWNYNAPPPPP